jgi:hypothetical protein
MRSARNIYNSLGLAQDNMPMPQERDRLLVSVYASATALIMLSPARQGRQLADMLARCATSSGSYMCLIACSIIEERFPLDAPFLFRELNEGSTANDCFGSALQTVAQQAREQDEAGQEAKEREKDGKRVLFEVRSFLLRRTGLT